MGECSNPVYIKDHVQGKLECIKNELDSAISSKEKEEEKRKEKEDDGKVNVQKVTKTFKWLPVFSEKEEKRKEKEDDGENEENENGIENTTSKKLIKTIEWLSAIAKKTEKIKKLVSQFGLLPDENNADAIVATRESSSTSKRQKQKTLSNTRQCSDWCTEESLLIWPMIVSLKKIYEHLPPNLRLCLLCLAVFPENFVIKKRPLICWWMAEGFIAATVEDDGEGNFMELIRMGFIQPFYEGNIGQPGDPSARACTMHPWIRRMLVSIALEANFFECYSREKKDEINWARVCLYNEVEDDETATRKTKMLNDEEFHDRLKQLKANLQDYERNVHNDIKVSNMPKVAPYYSRDEMRDWRRYRRFEMRDWRRYKRFAALADLRINCINELFTLLAEVNDQRKIKPWRDLEAVHQRIDDLHKRLYWQDDKTRALEHNDLEVLYSWVKDYVHDLEDMDRKRNLEELQKDDLFSHYDLKVHFPSPMKKRISDASNKQDHVEYYHQAGEKLLGIINVNQGYVDMKEEWFGKLKRLRTLHLGRWQDSQPVPHIEVENTGFLKALFQVAKQLKYLSLRGISRITELPSNISQCCNLQTLDLKACYNLESLPPEIGSLAKLTHFDVSECYLLQNNNLWSLVEKLKLLQTLTGLKWETDVSETSKLQNTKLMKLRIIFTTSILFTVSEDCLRNLRVLTLTWRTMRKKIVVKIQQLPQNLRKLDLRCYPGKYWPAWLHEHPTLETLYITVGKIERFPSDLTNFKFDNVQVLRLKYLTNSKLDFSESQLQTSFPSLKYHTGLNLLKNACNPAPSPARS